MAYTQNEKSTGLDTLNTLASGDLIIVGDVSDSGRAKAITETNFENTTGITQLKTDVTQLKTDVTNIQGDITTIFGDINNLQSQINNLSGGSGGGGKPMTFALTDFAQATGEPLNGFSDREALVYASGSTIIFQDILAYTQSRDLTVEWSAATGVQGYVVLGSYIYFLVTSGAALRVYRFSASDLSLGGTLVTFSGATLTYGAGVTMTSNGVNFFFNYDTGQSADSFDVSKFTISGTVLTYVSTVTCGSTPLQFDSKLAVDDLGNIYGSTGGILYQYDSTGALQYTSGVTLAMINDFFNWANTLYGCDTDSQVFTKLYLPDTDMSGGSSGSISEQNLGGTSAATLTAVARPVQSTSSQDGSVMYVKRFTDSGNVVSVLRYARDRNTGGYYVTHEVNLTGTPTNGNLGGICELGNFVYVSTDTGAAIVVKRLNKADLTSETAITVSGGPTTSNRGMFTDGTLIYIHSGVAGTWAQYSLSGTTITFIQNITGAVGNGVSSIYDGSLLHVLMVEDDGTSHEYSITGTSFNSIATQAYPFSGSTDLSVDGSLAMGLSLARGSSMYVGYECVDDNGTDDFSTFLIKPFSKPSLV